MRVAFDSNGYAYDVISGYYVNLEYDEWGNAFDVQTGEQIEEVILDSAGNTVYTGGGGINWNRVIDTAAQAYVGGEGAAQSGRYIPTQTASPGDYRTTGQGISGGAAISAGVGRGGITGGLNISTNTLLLGGLVLFAFIFGSKRGR